MKKVSLLLICLILLMAGCSSKEGGGQSKADQQKYKEDILAYNTFLTNTMDESNVLLSQYNTAIDTMYMENMNANQFGLIVKELIPKSTQIIKSVEKQDYFHNNIYRFHKEYLVYLNNQHQLFLDSMEMANREKVDKSKLRKRYIEIKDSQTTLLNSWGTDL